jgi:hypothetical protein
VALGLAKPPAGALREQAGALGAVVLEDAEPLALGSQPDAAEGSVDRARGDPDALTSQLHAQAVRSPGWAS